tara:strand:+ start:972 stop:1286 length:315 start_codon:yes stop_codon:yes gene_type:complete
MFPNVKGWTRTFHTLEETNDKGIIVKKRVRKVTFRRDFEPTVPYVDLSQEHQDMEDEVVFVPSPPKPPAKIIDLTNETKFREGNATAYHKRWNDSGSYHKRWVD